MGTCRGKRALIAGIIDDIWEERGMRSEVENALNDLKNWFENYKVRLENIEGFLGEEEIREDDSLIEEKMEIREELKWMRVQLIALVIKIGLIIDPKVDIPLMYSRSPQSYREIEENWRKLPVMDMNSSGEELRNLVFKW